LSNLTLSMMASLSEGAGAMPNRRRDRNLPE
jgi:hypothetical protein